MNKEMSSLKSRLVECEKPIGQKKTSTWKLPPVGFVYGKKEKEDPEGVSISNINKYNINSYT